MTRPEHVVISVWLVADDEESAKDAIIWDDYALAHEYQEDEGLAHIWAADAEVRFATMRLVD